MITTVHYNDEHDRPCVSILGDKHGLEKLQRLIGNVINEGVGCTAHEWDRKDNQDVQVQLCEDQGQLEFSEKELEYLESRKRK